MGEFTNGSGPATVAASDHEITGEPGKIDTGVEGVFADGERQGLPVFNVSKEEFYQNMDFGRKRLRFESGTPAQQFMKGSRYNKSFWIHDSESGHVRKIK